MIKDTFESISSICTTKIQQRLITKLIKKFSCKSTNDLANCSDLLSSLYLAGHSHEVLQIVSIMLKDIHFEGNFDLWPDYDFAIGYQIADETNDNDMKQRVYNKLCEVEAFTPAPGKICSNQNYFARILYKKRVIDSYQNIEREINEKDTEMEQSGRVSVVFEASLVKAVNFDKNPALTEEMNAAIAEQLEILKDEKFKKYI